MEWKSLFRSHILERGYGYYVDERVTDMKVSDGMIIATVDGSSEYHVTIELSEDEIESLYCDCPYALDGNYCKHMAAVLYQYFEDIDDEKDDEKDDEEIEYTDALYQRPEYSYFGEKVNKEGEEIKCLLEKIPEEEKTRMLVNMIRSDKNLRNSLQLKYDFKMDARQMLALKNEIKEIVYENTNRKGFVDWDHAYDFCSSLIQFLDKRIAYIVEQGYVRQAFELTNQVYKIIGTIDMDDSGGDSGLVARKCYECWKLICEKANDSDKKDIEKWFNSYKKGTLIDWIEDYLYEFINEELISEEQIVKKIKELDEMIEDAGESNDCGRIYFPNDGYCSVAEKRIDYMKKLRMSKQDIDEFCKRHRNFYVIRQMEIEKAIAEGNIDKAIEVLKESKERDCDYRNLVESYSEKLIELFHIKKYDQEYKKELIFNLMNCHQSDARYFCELKKMCKDEPGWETIVEKIIIANKGSFSVYDILLEENRYEEMADMMIETQNDYLMNNYIKPLSKNIPEKVIYFYSQYVAQNIVRASERKNYRKLVQYLKTMCFCDEGKKEAKKISDIWKVEYRRRSALMDELRKAGF